MDFKKYLDEAIALAIQYVPKVALALVVLWIGSSVIKTFTKIAGKAMERRAVDETLRPFLRNLINWALKAMLFISVASMVGIETTSFVAVLGAAGLAVGLALQGTLSNFAGGVLILIFRPFKVGDTITVMGHNGTVKEIQLFVTVVQTGDSRTIMLPNGVVANSAMTNYSTVGHIRFDMHFSLAGNANIDQARAVILEVLSKHPKVLKTPASSVDVANLNGGAINLVVRPYCSEKNIGDAPFDLYEHIKKALDSNNIPGAATDINVFMKS